MKNLVIASIIALSSISASAAVSPQVRTNAYEAIASVEHLNGSDVAEMQKFVKTSSEKELKSYMVRLAFQRSIQLDNPNEIDKEDIRLSLEKQDIAQLSKTLQSLPRK